MGLFSKRSKKERNAEWSNDAWRGLVSSVSKTAEMYCERFSAAVNSERASAAAHTAAEDLSRARAAAELALRNRAKVRALARLATLADQLLSRDLNFSSLNNLDQLREPARTEVVSFVYAAGRLSVTPLTEAVAMLRALFPDDVDDITRARNGWTDYLDTRLYDALTPGPADEDLVDKELAAAAKEYPEYSASGVVGSSAAAPGNTFYHDNTPTTGQPTGAYHDITPAGTQQPPHSAPPTLSIPGQYRPNSHRILPQPSPPPSGHQQPTRAATLPTVLSRPWEAGERPRVPVGLLQHPLGTIPPPPPPSQSNQPIPDYLRRFQDSDEAVQRRYRDLLTG